MKAWRNTKQMKPHDEELVLIDTKQVAYLLNDQWYLAHDDNPITAPYMWMPIPILPNE